MKVYLIQEYYTDVVCLRLHIDKNGKSYPCKEPIHSSRRIHEITSDLQYAIKSTIDKPNWSYESYELVVNG